MKSKLFYLSYFVAMAGVLWAGIAGAAAGWDAPISGRLQFQEAWPGLLVMVIGLLGVVFLDNDPPSFR